MWARTIEVAAGCWLLMSPFIFVHPSGNFRLWATDLVVGSLTIMLALISYWKPLRGAHWLTFAIAQGMVAAGFSSGTPAPAAIQNEILVGLLLAMLAIVPSLSESPPESWRRLNRQM